MTRLLARVVVLLLLVFPVVGCSLLAGRINRQFPPVSSADRQSEATDIAAQDLATLQRADALMTIGTSDISGQLAQVLKASDSRIRSVALRSGRQEIVADVGFDGDFPEAHVSLRGKATIRAAMAVDDQTLIIRPSASWVHIDRARVGDKRWSVDILLPLINPVLRRFLDNINGTIAAQRYPLDFSVVKSYKPAEALRNTPGIISAEGPDIEFGFILDRSALLIDDSGVHALAQLQAPSRVWIIDCSKGEPKKPEIDCSIDCNPLDVLCVARKAACELEKARQLAEYEGRVNSYRSLCGTATPAQSRTLPPPPAGTFDTRFAALSRSFRQCAELDLGPVPSRVWTRSAAMVSKQFLAESHNHALSDATVYVEYGIPRVQKDLNQMGAALLEPLKTPLFS